MLQYTFEQIDQKFLQKDRKSGIKKNEVNDVDKEIYTDPERLKLDKRFDEIDNIKRILEVVEGFDYRKIKVKQEQITQLEENFDKMAKEVVATQNGKASDKKVPDIDY